MPKKFREGDVSDRMIIYWYSKEIADSIYFCQTSIGDLYVPCHKEYLIQLIKKEMIRCNYG